MDAATSALAEVPLPSTDETGAEVHEQAAATLRHLAAALPNMHVSDIDWGTMSGGSSISDGNPIQDGQNQAQRSGGLLIQDITDEASGAAGACNRLNAAQLVGMCALYAADTALDSTWVTQQTSAAATAVLIALASLLQQHIAQSHRPSQRWQQSNAEGSSEGPAASAATTNQAAQQPDKPDNSEVTAAQQQADGNEPSEERQKPDSRKQQQEEEANMSDPQLQKLLAVLLPELLLHLRPSIASHQSQRTAAGSEPQQGPGEFERYMAARQVAWLGRRLQDVSLEGTITTLLPALLTFTDDASVTVQRAGLATLEHLAEAAPRAALAARHQLLLDTAVRAVTAADERVWTAAAPAACTLVVALEGDNPWAQGYDRLMIAMLGEAEMHQQNMSHSRIWLQAVQKVLEALKGVAVRYFARLMPLLLSWLHGGEVLVREEAVKALTTVIRNCWARMPAHAHFIWQHLQKAYEEVLRQKGGAVDPTSNLDGTSGAMDEMNSLGEAAKALYDAGGEEFQQSVKDTQLDPTARCNLWSHVQQQAALEELSPDD